MIHATAHPKAGQVVTLSNDQQFEIEDWWDRMAGESWMMCEGNPAALSYAIRCGFQQLPLDDEVVYGKIDHLGHIIHVSEIRE